MACSVRLRCWTHGMRIMIRFALSIGVIALFAGCARSQMPIETPGAVHIPALGPPIESSDYKVTPPLLYVTNGSATYDDVRIYQARARDPAPLATISEGVNNPTGACVDGQGTLYITNEPSDGLGWVSEYPLGKTSSSRIIRDGIKTPSFCAVDGQRNLWVTDISGPNVTEYSYGSKKPHTVITNGLVYPLGIAIDHSGDLYVGNGFGASQQNVEVYSPGGRSPSRTITNGITSPCGLAVDSNGTLYVANEFQNNVEEYRRGRGAPFQTITKGIDAPAGVMVNKKGTLYVSNLGNNTVLEFPRGSLTPSKRQISKGLYDPSGLASYPPALP